MCSILPQPFLAPTSGPCGSTVSIVNLGLTSLTSVLVNGFPVPFFNAGIDIVSLAIPCGLVDGATGGTALIIVNGTIKDGEEGKEECKKSKCKSKCKRVRTVTRNFLFTVTPNLVTPDPDPDPGPDPQSIRCMFVAGPLESFALLASRIVFNDGDTTVINGDVGVSFPPSGIVFGLSENPMAGEGRVNGSIDLNAAAELAQAIALRNALAALPPTSTSVGGLIGTGGSQSTFTPGVFAFDSTVTIDEVLTLDGQGDLNAQFVFQIDGDFAIDTLSSIELIGGAQACNVFFQVDGLVMLGANSIFQGTIVSDQFIISQQGVSGTGRLIAPNAPTESDSSAGIIAIADNIISVPTCTSCP